MRMRVLAMVATVAIVTGCSKAADRAGSSPAPMAVKRVTMDAKEAAPATAQAIPVSLPRIAYTYDYGFRLAAHDIAGLQQRQADYCAKQGPTVCQIIAMQQDRAAGGGSGELHLAVAAARARGFGAELARLAGDSGGELVSSAISGEDLSKKLVDTDARLKARTVMRDRLMQVLATRQGKVSELVEAEKAVADANEDIDAARSELADMQGRVDFSQIKIEYSDGAGGGFLGPIADALRDLGGLLGGTVALLLRLVVGALPFALLGWGLWWLWPRLRQALRRRPPPGETGDQE